jgi:hypothetical protein
MAVIELRSAERTEPAEGEDKEQSVSVRVSGLEVANVEQEDALRQVMRALHLQRTAYGTLTEEGDIELAASTIEDAAGEFASIEAARLHVAIDRWVGYGRAVLSRSKTTQSEMRAEFDTVLKGLMAAVDPSQRKD